MNYFFFPAWCVRADGERSREEMTHEEIHALSYEAIPNTFELGLHSTVLLTHSFVTLI